MLERKLERFILKRVLILFIILAIFVLLMLKSRWTTLEGLAAGTVLGIIKLYFLGAVFSKLLLPGGKQSTTKKSVLKYMLGQILVILILVLSVLKFGVVFFIALTAGVLLVPLVVLMNSITEGLGITHNNFE